MYTFTSRVRYSELDEKRKLSIPAIMNYFQDASTFQSESLGVGMDYLKKEHTAWLLAHWHIDFVKEAHIGEELEISTWPYGFDKLFGYRNFTIKSNGEYVAIGESKWVEVDLTTGSIRRIEDRDIEKYKMSEQLEPGSKDEKLRPSKTWEEEETFPVRQYLVDTNGHVNNEKYVMLAMEYLEKDQDIHGVIVEYKKQATVGKMIKSCVEKQENGIFVGLLDPEDNKPYALVKFLL